MAGDWMLWISALALTFGVGACIALLTQSRKLCAARADIEQLGEQLLAAQEHSQRELLAMGQRVIEADKLVRRFNERLDALENAQPVEPHYGQLGDLLAGVASRETASAQSEAEEKLLALLRRAGG